MDEFFEAPPPEPECYAEESEPPPWLGPPLGVIPCAVPMGRVLARSDRAAVGIAGALAYGTGFEMQFVALLARDAAREADLDPFEIRPSGRRQDALAPGVLRLGLEYADGRKAMNTTGHWHQLGEDKADESVPTMVEQGGSGGERQWRESYWCWPLPPPGSLQLVCEWPALGIPLTRSEVDAGLLLDAAARAQEVFPAAGTPGLRREA